MFTFDSEFLKYLNEEPMRFIYSVFSFLLVLSFLLSSCSIEKRRYESGFYIQSKKTNAVSKANSATDRTSTLADIEPVATQELALLSHANNSALEPGIEVVPVIQQTRIPEIFSTALPAKDSLQPCSKLVLNNGNEISALVIEIGTTEVRYKRCENQAGPDYVLPKSLIFLIQSPNGENEIISPKADKPSESGSARTNPLGVLGTLFGALGLLAFGIPLGILALILSGLALGKIKQEPDRHKGKGWAIAGMILGGLSILGGVLYIALFL